MKIKINIREVAESNGIKKPYQLQKKANLTPSNAINLFNNDIKLISIETLGKLCEAFSCEPNDLFLLSKEIK